MNHSVFWRRVFHDLYFPFNLAHSSAPFIFIFILQSIEDSMNQRKSLGDIVLRYFKLLLSKSTFNRSSGTRCYTSLSKSDRCKDPAPASFCFGTLGHSTKGRLPIYVGAECKKYTIRLKQLRNPLMIELLNNSAAEYGYSQSGPLRVICEPAMFEAIFCGLSSRCRDSITDPSSSWSMETKLSGNTLQRCMS